VIKTARTEGDGGRRSKKWMGNGGETMGFMYASQITNNHNKENDFSRSHTPSEVLILLTSSFPPIVR
jgi:hypothetical protein